MAWRALENSCGNGLLIDLGAGGGVVTASLLKAGISADRIIGVEISEKLAAAYRKRFQNVKLFCDDASRLPIMLDYVCPQIPITAIISSLPFRSLDAATATLILGSLHGLLLRRGGIFVQYTYALWKKSSLEPYGFGSIDHGYVFQNCPPAMVEAYYPMNNQCRVKLQ